MAFTSKEQEIIKWGLQNGKSKEEVKTAIAKYRTGATTKPAEAPQPGFLAETGQDIKSTIQNISAAGDEAASGIGDAIQATKNGEQGVGRGIFQSLGSLAKGASGVIGNAFAGAIKSILPQGGEDAIKSGVAAVATPIMNNPDIKTIMSNYEALKNDPSPESQRLARDLESVLGLSQAVFDVAGAGIGKKVGTAVVDTAISAGEKVAAKAGDVADMVKIGAKNLAETAGSKVESLVARPVPKPVESVLKEVPAAQFDEYAAAARKATLNYKNPTPLEIAGKKAQSALDTIQRKLDSAGEQKGAVLNQAAVGNKPVGDIVLRFRQNLKNYLSGKMSVEGDSKLIQDVTSKAEALGANPSAKQVDQFIDYVQDRIYTGSRDLTVPVTNEATASLRRITGELNESLKNQLPDSYRNLNDQYSKIVDVRNELNVKLGKEGEKGGTLMKRVFSPSDANTKQLFEEVKKLTGVDLTNEATLARFTMEVMGDARQASMLEQLQIPNMSKTGVANFLMDKATGKFNTPDAIFRRARGLTIQ